MTPRQGSQSFGCFLRAVLSWAPLQCAGSDARFSHPQSSKCAVCRGRAATKFKILSQIKALCGCIYPLLQDERERGGFWASLENALWAAPSCLPAGGNALIDVMGLIKGINVAVSEVSVQCAILFGKPRPGICLPRGRRLLQTESFVWKPLDASS